MSDDVYKAVIAATKQMNERMPVTVISYTSKVTYTEQRCECGERAASQCEEPWGPECDLGSNEKYTARYNIERCPNCDSLEKTNTELDRKLGEIEQRTLTDEVIADLWHQNGGFHHHFARAVERYLKGEK